MFEFLWQVGVVILIAIILFVIMWFLWPAGTRPLKKNEPRKRVVFIPRDGKPIDITDQVSHFDYTNVTVTPIKDPEYADYLKNFPADDPRR